MSCRDAHLLLRRIGRGEASFRCKRRRHMPRLPVGFAAAMKTSAPSMDLAQVSPGVPERQVPTRGLRRIARGALPELETAPPTPRPTAIPPFARSLSLRRCGTPPHGGACAAEPAVYLFATAAPTVSSFNERGRAQKHQP
eukprot:362754-Chlamydomonas_euryale.AAC.16